MGKRDIQWTEAHRKEALARQHEIAAGLVRGGNYEQAQTLVGEDFEDAAREDWWRGALYRAGLDHARIDREVRRVCALAEERLVRETSSAWRVTDKTTGKTIAERRNRDDAGRELIAVGGRMHARIVRVRITRIRKAAKS